MIGSTNSLQIPHFRDSDLTRKGDTDPWVPPILEHMDLIFQQYEERLIRRRRSKSTLVGFRQAILPYQAWLGERDARTPTPWEVEEYFAALPHAPSTKRQYLTNVRAAYRYALARGTIDHDPTIDVEIERAPDKEPQIIPNGELRACRQCQGCEKLCLLFDLLVYTGMRRHEIAALHWEDVNLVRSSLRVLGKGGKLRHVPIHPVLLESLTGRSRHIYWRVTTSAHYNALSKMGMGHYGFHAFRRTAASSLRRNGVSPHVIDKIFGWAPRTVRDRYYVNVADEEMQAAILRLYVDDPL